MAVFTKVSDAGFVDVLKNYSIGEFESAQEIAEGVENTNYFLNTSEARYIFTIYEKRVDPQDLPFFMEIQARLNDSGIPCPKPIADDKGEVINKIGDKLFTIVTCLNGSGAKKVTNQKIYNAGKLLGEIHNKTSQFDGLSRENSLSIDFWKETYKAVQSQAEGEYRGLAEDVRQAFEIIEKDYPTDLQSGIIHADYFPDNVLFTGSDATGVIDFYMACEDFYIYDLAIALNAWCFEKDYSFNITKTSQLLKGYNSTKNFNQKELEKLPVLCIGASMRFLSSRLYDYFNTDPSALISVKDPKEYVEKLKFHLQVKGHGEYGI